MCIDLLAKQTTTKEKEDEDEENEKDKKDNTNFIESTFEHVKQF